MSSVSPNCTSCIDYNMEMWILCKTYFMKCIRKDNEVFSVANVRLATMSPYPVFNLSTKIHMRTTENVSEDAIGNATITNHSLPEAITGILNQPLH